MKALAETPSSSISFRHHIPQGSLSEFVGLFWHWQGHDISHSAERILPTGTVELVIDLGSDRTSDSVVSGPMSESFIIERSAQEHLLGIHFKPGGIFPFLKCAFAEIHNTTITLSDFWGEQEATQLLTHLYKAKSVDLRFQILEKWLLQKAQKPLRHHQAVTFALKEFQNNPGSLSSAEMADKVGYSQRRFIQIFRNEVGLTPKLFSRVQRFQRIIKTIAHLDEINWLDLSLSNGYFDQSHFNHDFHEFSRLTPSEYLGLRTEHLQHVKLQS